MARPLGSTTRPQIKDFIGKEDIIKLTEKAMSKAKEGDVVMLKFLLEQVYGKAPQSMDITSAGKSLNIGFDGLFKATPKTGGNNKK